MGRAAKSRRLSAGRGQPSAPVPLDVSDHACLRFLERAGGLDVEAVKAAIGSAVGTAAAWAELASIETFTVEARGLRFVVRDGVVVTVAPAKSERGS